MLHFMQKQHLFLLAVLPIIILLSGLLVLTPVAAAALSSTLTCSRAGSILPAAPSNSRDTYLEGTSANSATDAWAVGAQLNASFTYQTFTEHWDGTSWNPVSSPNMGTHNNYLNDVTSTSQEAWTVGYYQTPGGNLTLTEHWNGNNWVIIPSPNVSTSLNTLNAITIIGPNNAWAVGNAQSASGWQALIEHWNGNSWSIVPGSNPGSDNYLNAIGAISANDIWAVGSYLTTTGTYKELIEHWDGSNWNRMDSTYQGTNNGLNAIIVLSSNNIWAVGYSNQPRQTLTEHWNGISWQKITSPNVSGYDNVLTGVAATSSTAIWSVGYANQAPNGTPQLLVEEWNGSTWTLLPSTRPPGTSALYATTFVPGTNQLWAVGSNTINTRLQTVTAVYC